MRTEGVLGRQGGPNEPSDGSATASARRQFPYGLSRADVEAAILAGP